MELLTSKERFQVDVARNKARLYLAVRRLVELVPANGLVRTVVCSVHRVRTDKVEN